MTRKWPISRLKPPGHLLQRVRWIFLLASLLMAFFQVYLILTVDNVAWPFRALGIVSILCLCWWWGRRYRRASFPFISFPFESVAIFVVTLAIGDPPFSLGLIYMSLLFRSLYGSWRAFLALLAGYLVAFYGAVAVSLTLLAGLAVPLWLVLPEGIGLIMLSTVLHALARVLGKHERSMSRERTLREAGTRLVSTLDRESIYQATLEAALGLVEDAPDARVGLATGSEEGMTVVAAAGYRAAEIRGDRFNVHTFPGPLRVRLLQNQPVEVERPESSDLREALGLASRTRPFFVTPMLIADELRGVIGVTSASTLPQESKEGLAALGSQVSLALESNALAEEAHKRKSEERFRSLIQNASDIVMITEADGTLSYISPAVEQVLGYKPEDIIGTDSFVPVHADDAERVRGLFEEVASKPGVTLAFELRLRHADGSWRHLESSCTNLLHDPTVSGLVVNSRDITERKRSEKRLQESEANLAQAQRIARLGSWEYEPKENRVRWSDETYRIFGFAPQQFVPTLQDFLDVVHPEDKMLVQEDMAKIFHGEQQPQDSIEFRIVRPYGEVRFVRGQHGAEYDETNALIKIVGTIQDVTETRLVEEQIRFQAHLLGQVQAAVIATDLEGTVTYWNEHAERLYGWSREEALGRNSTELTFGLTEAGQTEEIMEQLRNIETWEGEAELRRKDGSTFLAHVIISLTYDVEGRPVGIVGVSTDITERKRAEEELHQSEERYRAVVEQATDGILLVDIDTKRLLESNAAYQNLLGYAREEILQLTLYEVVPYSRENMDCYVERVVAQRRYVSGERRHLRKDGSLVDVEVSANVISYGGREALCIVVHDITERKQAEEELRRSERELAEAQRMAHVGNWSFDVTRNEGRWSDEMYRIFGFVPQEFLVTYRKFLNLVHPDDKELLRRAVRAALYGDKDRYNLDYRLIRPDGEVRYLHSEYELVRDESERTIRLVGTSQDVTERELAERARRQSEERFRRLVEQAADALFVHDLDGRFVEVNRQACESLGYTQEELLSMSVSDIEENFDSQELAEIWENVASDGATMIDGIHRHKNGTRFPVEIRVGLFETDSERLMLAVVRDVTERKRAEEALRESEKRYRVVVQQAVEGMFLVDLDTKRILEANDAYRVLLGYDAEGMLGLTLYDVVAHDRESIDFHVRRIANERSHVIGERQHRRKDGSLIEVEAGASLISYGGRNVMSVVVHDITERRRAEEELRKSEARNRAIIEATPDLMFRLSRDGEYLDFQANDDGKLYVPHQELVGKNLRETVPPELGAPMLRNIAKTLDSGEMQVFEYQLPMADEVLDFEARLVVSGAEEVLAIVRDITKRKALERRLEHQAFHDALTGLPNRALFVNRLEHALVRAERHQESVAVLFMDLDNFKIVNDSLGHEAGDRLLVAVAERLQKCLRVQDTLARLGGDEFTILLEDIKGSHEASGVAERVAEALRDPFEIERQQEVFVTASIGIAFGDSTRDLPGLLLRNADLAMYQAKDTGKARYEVFDPGMNERLLERMKLENELRRALEKNELRVYYQPKLQLVEWDTELKKRLRPMEGQDMAVSVALPKDRIVGAEALVRWDHPERGLVLPDQFVPMAEETGLIIPIGRWVLRKACRQAQQWQESYPSDPPLMVSVNLSAREFQQHDLVEAVAGVLGETGLEPCGLEIEITESTLMEDTQHTIDTLRALKELGVQLSIDDFGTGYSSLSYLRRFPVDSLKIDKSFIDKLGKSYKDTALVSSTIDLSHAFGLRVVAEGLETADQLRRLRELGCDQAQGYYFSKPLPNRAISAMLGTAPEDERRPPE